MNKLLSAGFVRLWRDKVFWICTAIMALFGGIMPITSYSDMRRYDTIAYIDSTFFSYALLVLIAISIFTPLFLGTDYSNGTIRNKITVGQRRDSIYLSNLIVVFSAGVLFSLAYLIPCLSIGLLLLGFFRLKFSLIILLVLGIYAMLLAVAALCTLFSMLNQSRAIVAVLCILLIFLLIFAGSYIEALLDQPEYYDVLVTTEEGMETKRERNPRFVSGATREFLEFFTDFNPGGQAFQYVSIRVEKPLPLILYSLFIAALSTSAGLFFFRRKDLK